MYALKVVLALGTLHVRGWGCFPNEGTGPMTIEDRPRSQWEDYENVKVAYKVALGGAEGSRRGSRRGVDFDGLGYDVIV